MNELFIYPLSQELVDAFGPRRPPAPGLKISRDTLFVEVRGSITRVDPARHVLPPTTCPCAYHWRGWAKEGVRLSARQWNWHFGRPALTKKDIADGWRAAARGYRRDGNREMARQCFRQARAIDRPSTLR